jgi:hypothetical protein
MAPQKGKNLKLLVLKNSLEGFSLRFGLNEKPGSGSGLDQDTEKPGPSDSKMTILFGSEFRTMVSV